VSGSIDLLQRQAYALNSIKQSYASSFLTSFSTHQTDVL